MSEMIDKVAAALADFYDDGLNVDSYKIVARAAIEAMREPTDDQPRYTTARLHDEIAKAKAYARREALEEAAKVVMRNSPATQDGADVPLQAQARRTATAVRNLAKEQA